MRVQKRIAALLLAGSMLLPTPPMAAAVEAADGLCEHHRSHTGDCGYAAAEGACTFVCQECRALPKPVPGESGISTWNGLPETSTTTGPALDLPVMLDDNGEPFGPQFLTALRAGGAVSVSTNAQFMAALRNGNSPITVTKTITLVEGADPDGRLQPIPFPGNVTIQGNGPESMLVSRAPIQLEGDNVTFQNIALIFNSSDSLGSIPHREIFLAGHSLTLDNVNTYLKGDGGSLGGFGSSDSELLPTVYAGGYRGTSVGSNASLTVANSNSQTMFQGIYLGHGEGGYEMTPYTGDAVLSLDAKALSRDGVFSQGNTSAEITIQGNNSSGRVTRFTGDENTRLTLDNVTLSNAQMAGVGTVSLKNGAVLEMASGELTNVELPDGTRLSVTGLGNAVIAGNFSGGGKLELDPNGSVAINGTIAGTTTVAAGSFLSPQLLIAGRAYIIPSSEMGEGNPFELHSHDMYTDKFSLDYIKGRGWVASQLYEDTVTPTIGSIEILSAPTAVDRDTINDVSGTDVTFQIVWRDMDGAVISSSTIYDEGFYDLGTLGYYAIILKTELLSSSVHDNQYYEASGLSLGKQFEDSTDLYYLYNTKTDTDQNPIPVPPGNYTLLLLSEGLDLENKTLAEFKTAIEGKVAAQASFDVYAPADPGTTTTDISQAAIVSIPDQTYTGRPLTPEVTVTLDGKTLTAGTDYVVNYMNNTAPGKGLAAAKVIGIGSYSGEKTVPFNIVDAESALSLTINGSQNATAVYGDALRFVFQAAPKTQNTRAARAAAENTVEFVCGTGADAQVIGTANVSADGQAVLNYKTTDRRIPIGTSQIGVRFGGSTGLQGANQDSLATVTLDKATLKENGITSIALKDFTYDGKNTQTDLLYATVDGQTVALTGKAELSSTNADEYTTAKVLSWALDGEEALWYDLPAAPDSITVEPGVKILKREHPAPANQYITVKPGDSVTHDVSDLLPPETATFSPGALTGVSYQNGVLTIQAAQGATSPMEGEVTFEYDNYQTVTMHLQITVTNDDVSLPDIAAANKVFDGQKYNGLTGADISKVHLTYRNLTEQVDLTEAPTEVGRYSVTASWNDGTPGVTSREFSITPYPIEVAAMDRTISVGDTAPDLGAPAEGVDYRLSAQPIGGYSLGSVRMAYESAPNTGTAGSYEILVGVENANPNYLVSTKNARLTISDQPAVGVTGVALDQNALTLSAGETAVLQATVQPQNAANREVRWSSNNEAVATVDQNGQVQAVAQGSATITVTTVDGGHTASCAVTVTPREPGSVAVTGVELDRAEMILTAGEEAVLKATVAPQNATNQEVQWSSNNEAVATVDQNGQVQAVAQGSATITVTTVDGGHTASCAVAVTPREPGSVAVTGVELDRAEMTLTAGNMAMLFATVAPENATNREVQWSSNNEAVATVDQGGGVRAVAPGSATITVTTVDGGYTASCAVTVNPRAPGAVAVTGVELNRTDLKLTVGSGSLLRATVLPSNATNKAVSWQVDEPSIATVDQDGYVTGIAPGSTLVTVATADGGYTATCEVTVQKRADSGSSGGSGGSSGGAWEGGSSAGGSSGGSGSSSGKQDGTAETKPSLPTTSTTKPVAPDAAGNVTVQQDAVVSAIAAAKDAANKNGTSENGISVTVPVATAEGQTSVQVAIQGKALDALVKEGVRQLNITTDHLISASIGQSALRMLDSISNGGNLILQVKAKPQTVLSQEAKAAIGARPTYDLSLCYLSGGNQVPVTNFGGSSITVRLPYTPAEGEKTGNLYGIYLGDGGKVEWLTKSSYDADQRAIVFETDHFSVYGVGYRSSAPAFTDIADHWAADSILFVASRGLISGTGETTFSPDLGMTRGALATALGQLAGIQTDRYQTGRFTDVKADAYQAPYIHWAAQSGIMAGTTATTFAPEANVTREQLAVILRGYAKKLGYALPKALEAVTFADEAQISSQAKEAVRALQQAGVLAGKESNRFDPKGTATRAEVATVLRRLVEVFIDPQAAEGWAQNHSGQWSYFRNGKPGKGWLTSSQTRYWLDRTTGTMFAGGWKQIDGKWYYFYADGSMAVNTTIDGYPVGADGARA